MRLQQIAIDLKFSLAFQQFPWYNLTWCFVPYYKKITCFDSPFPKAQNSRASCLRAVEDAWRSFAPSIIRRIETAQQRSGRLSLSRAMPRHRFSRGSGFYAKRWSRSNAGHNCAAIFAPLGRPIRAVPFVFAGRFLPRLTIY